MLFLKVFSTLLIFPISLICLFCYTQGSFSREKVVEKEEVKEEILEEPLEEKEKYIDTRTPEEKAESYFLDPLRGYYSGEGDCDCCFCQYLRLKEKYKKEELLKS